MHTICLSGHMKAVTPTMMMHNPPSCSCSAVLIFCLFLISPLISSAVTIYSHPHHSHGCYSNLISLEGSFKFRTRSSFNPLSRSTFREAGVHQTAGEPGGVGRRHGGLLLRGARRPDADCPLAEGGGRVAPGQVRRKRTRYLPLVSS